MAGGGLLCAAIVDVRDAEARRLHVEPPASRASIASLPAGAAIAARAHAREVIAPPHVPALLGAFDL
jgi:hypothetical protein